MKALLSLALILSIHIGALAQTDDSLVNAKIRVWNRYASGHSPDIFLQLDKTVYTPNENIFFTAWLLDRGADTTEPDVLHIVLIDVAAKKVLAADRFLLRGGISSGSLMIPDSAGNGEYLVIAYTNTMRNGSGDRFFREHIRIRTGKISPFNLTVSAGDTQHDSIPLTCRITTDYGGLASGAAYNYSLYADGRLLQSGKRIIDPFGEARLSLPAKDTLAEAILLYATISRQGVTRHLRTPLTLRPKRINVSWYPEGGILVDGHPTRMGITLNTTDGMGIATTGALIEDGKARCEFKTDGYGLATLTFEPHKGSKYQLQLAGLPTGAYACGRFPDVLATGFTLGVASGVCRDTLTVNIRGPRPDSKGAIIVYNDHALLYTARIGLPSGSGRLTIPIKDWPRGMAEIALFNDDGSPAAETPIFLPAPKLTMTIQTDSLNYHPRSKVKCHLKLTDEQNRGVAGLFSLASIQSARLNTHDYRDIVKHADFDPYLPPGQRPMPALEYFDNDTAIDRLLLTRLSAAGRWLAMEQDTAITPTPSPAAEDYGYVLYDGEKVKRPVPLILMGSSMYRFTTDPSGRFQLPANALIAPFGTNPMLAVMDKNDQAAFNIIVKNRYDSINDELAAAWYAPQQWLDDTTVKDQQQSDQPFNSVKTLKTVVVRSHSGELRPYPGRCSDRVCMYGILNCPNHPGCCRVPRNGEDVIIPGSRMHMIYAGNCAENTSFLGSVRGVHLLREYYNKDSASFSPSEPALLSTVYWAPVVETDSTGEATINFYTDDITGRFMTIVQGIAGHAVFSAKEYFMVIP
jgi:hypothetical protein